MNSGDQINKYNKPNKPNKSIEIEIEIDDEFKPVLRVTW
jgi:hypothetical protein